MISASRRGSLLNSAALLIGTVWTAALVASAFTTDARAGSYTANDEDSLRAAISAANADGDANATITLTGNIAIADPTAFPAFAKPTTINTGAFTLSGADIASGAGNGSSLAFSGGALLTTSGTVRGGNADTNTGTGQSGVGGTGASVSNGSVQNTGTITGGAGGGRSFQGAGAGGRGATLTNSTLVNQGTISGGLGGDTNSGGGSAGSGRGGGAGGVGVVMSGGSLDNRSQIVGGDGGSSINTAGGTDNFFGGLGGVGAQLTGGTHTNSGTITGGQGGIGRNSVGGAGSAAGGAGLVLDGAGSFVNNGSIAGGLGRQEAWTTRGSAGGAGALVTNSTLSNNSTISGGAGVGTGAGGTGLSLTGSTATNSGTISGGTGGTAGTNTVGVGGTGITLSNSTLTNTATITGGTGGSLGGASGAGGVGITGTGGASVITSGTISGGLAGNGTRNNAITFTAGGNSLELRAGYQINGNVVATAGDSFILGGSANSTFNASQIGAAAQYRNFGTYQKTGESTWTLTDTTTAVTSWQILDGTLSVSSDGNLGALAGTLTLDGGTLQNTAAFSSARTVTIEDEGGTFQTNADLTWMGGIGGAGALTKTGTGTLTLTGANDYAGGTNINGGVVAVSLDDNLGTTAGPLSFNGGTLQNTGAFTSARSITLNASGGTFQTDADLALSGPIEGTGGLTKTGLETLVLTGTGSYSGLTTISAGRLQLGDGGTSGSIAGDILNNGVLAFNRSDPFLVPGAISGSGAVEQIGGGTTVLGADNTYTGGTTISAGTLQLGNGGTTGAILGDVLNDSALAFNRSNTYTFDGAISGSGTVSQVGSGTTVLTGTNLYSGGTFLEAGVLSVSRDDNLGDAAGALTFDGGTLRNTAAFTSARTAILDAGGGAFQTNANLTLTGLIDGTGTLIKTGNAALILTGDNSAFSGSTAVAQGTLAVNGSLCGDMNVLAGGRLQGTGTVCDTSNAGIIAPGNSIGTLTVDGDYAGNGGALEMEAELGGTGSPADRLLISGNVTGATMVNVINVGGSGAETGTGSADGISIIQVGGTSSADAFQLAGSYVAAGPYQYHLNAFDPAASADGEMDPILAALGAADFWDYRLQSTGIPVPQVAGYQSLPSGALNYGWSLLDSVHKRLGEFRHLAAVQKTDLERGQRAELFLRGSGADSRFDGHKGPDYDQTTWFIQGGGNFVGWDIGEAGGTLRGGLAASVGGSQVVVKTTSAKVELDGPGIALMGTYQDASGWYLDAVAQGTRYDATVKTSERGEVGSTDGWGLGLSLEGGHPFDLGERVVLEPQAQLAYQHVWFDTFTDVDDIAVDLPAGESLRGRLGARLQKTFLAEHGGKAPALWSPYLQLDVIHEFLDGSSVDAAGVGFASDTGGTSIRLGGGLEAQFGPNTAIFAHVDYESGLTDGTADTIGGTAGLRFNF